MAVSQNQRLRKAAAKAAKRKAIVTEKQAQDRRELAISKPRHIDLAASPIRECLINRNAFETGVATVFVARNLSLGRVGMAVFLADLLCLGIKDAVFRVMPALDFENMCRNFDEREPLMPIEPSAARKLLRGAEEYATSIGLPPAPAYAEVEPIFGDTPLARETFTYGKNGKPLYMVGPRDSPRAARRVFETLTDRLGTRGFDFLSPFPLSADHFDDYDYDNDVGGDEGRGIEGEIADDKAA